jgi:hypothetical protein
MTLADNPPELTFARTNRHGLIALLDGKPYARRRRVHRRNQYYWQKIGRCTWRVGDWMLIEFQLNRTGLVKLEAVQDSGKKCWWISAKAAA